MPNLNMALEVPPIEMPQLSIDEEELVTLLNTKYEIWTRLNNVLIENKTLRIRITELEIQVDTFRTELHGIPDDATVTSDISLIGTFDDSVQLSSSNIDIPTINAPNIDMADIDSTGLAVLEVLVKEENENYSSQETPYIENYEGDLLDELSSSNQDMSNVIQFESTFSENDSENVEVPQCDNGDESDDHDESALVDELILPLLVSNTCPMCQLVIPDNDELKAHIAKHMQKKPFPCDKCNKSYATKRQLRKHMLVHSAGKSFCDICSKSFVSVSGYKLHVERMHEGKRPETVCCTVCGGNYDNITQHMLTHSTNKPFQCSMCPFKFRLKSHWKRHMKIHSNEKTRVCQVCNDAFRTSNELRTHQMRHMHDHGFYCPHCWLPFKTPRELAEHKERHQNDKPYSCHTCGKKCKTANEVTTHAEVHINGATYCIACDKHFVSMSALELHMNVHNNIRPHACTLCDKTYITKRRLRTHIAEHTNKKPECELCCKSFINKHSLKKHIERVHYGERPKHCCEICGEYFDSIKAHMMVHSADTPFSCSVCGDSFKRKRSRDTHMLNHTGEKPFPCTQCNLAFKRQDHLNSHKRKHTGEKPFHCEFCSMKFSTSSQRSAHNRTHTGSKPFSCPTCGRGFAQKQALHRHLLTHTGERPHACHVCEKRFVQAHHLQTHLRLLHSVTK